MSFFGGEYGTFKFLDSMVGHYLFVLRFYGPIKPIGHVEHSQFT